MGNKCSAPEIGWNLLKLDRFCNDEHNIIEYFTANGTIPASKFCPQCKTPMTLANLMNAHVFSNNLVGYVWG
jgi:hypothetical protein